MQVARMVGIGRMTLIRWIKTGKIKEPRKFMSGTIQARIWTEQDVESVKKYKHEKHLKGRKSTSIGYGSSRSKPTQRKRRSSEVQHTSNSSD
jgi:predicted DNA-binding transcriptional regulator AlpA